MFRALTTFIHGIVLAVLILAVALAAAVWVIGMAAKAALFGEPRATMFVKLYESAMRNRQKPPTDITHISPDK